MQATPVAGGSQILTRDEAQTLTRRVLSFSSADQTRVTVVSERSGNTRFADGSITTSGGTTDTSVTVTVTFGRRRASSSTNVLEETSLKRTVDLASRLARLAPEDPELRSEQLARGSSRHPRLLHEPRLRDGSPVRDADHY